MALARRHFVWWHRWTGLVMALFLIIAGATGAVLTFYSELDRAMNPALFRVAAASPPAEPLAWTELRERVLAALPGARIDTLYFERTEGTAAVLWLEEPIVRPAATDARTYPAVHVNPYTGAIIGFRDPDRLSDGIGNLMPFLYALHYSLALGTVGTWGFGLVALVWTLDCFIGAYLTFPPRNPSAPARPLGAWIADWRQSWRVRWAGGTYKLSFDLHRAGGLWFWALLFVIAWSSVHFNLNQVYRPVMGVMFAFAEPPELPRLPEPMLEPPVSWAQAHATARATMERVATERGLTINFESRLGWRPETGLFHYRVNSSADIRDRGGSTSILFEPLTGEVRHVYLPTGAAAGDTITSWLVFIHMANVGGMPVRILILVAGLGVVMVSVTGIVIWWKKRRGRVRRARRAIERAGSAPAPAE